MYLLDVAFIWDLKANILRVNDVGLHEDREWMEDAKDVR